MMRCAVLAGVLTGVGALMTAMSVHAQEPSSSPQSVLSAPQVSAERRTQLVRMVRQDCGSCHGMRLTGGLGPALTRQALAGKPPEYLAAVIFNGLAGTPMPPWSAMLQHHEAQWIAEQLAQGFPEEHRSSPP